MKTTNSNKQFSHSLKSTSRASKLSRIGLTLTLTALLLCSLAASAATCKLVSGDLVQISAGTTQVWGLDGHGNVFQYDKKKNAFNQEHGALSQIAVGKGKNVWGLNASQDIYQYNFKTKEWQEVAGVLVQIAAGGGGVWGINSSGQIYYYNGTKFVQFTNGTVPVAKYIAVGADEPWVLDSSGSPWLYNTNTGYFDQVQDATLTQIAVGNALEAWGVNGSQDIFEYNINTERFDEVHGLLIQVSVFNNSNIWGVNAGGAAYKFIKGKFEQQCTSVNTFSQISAGGPAAGVWALTSSGRIYKF